MLGIKLSVLQSWNVIYCSIITMLKKYDFPIFVMQNFDKKTHMNSIYFIGIMFVR